MNDYRIVEVIDLKTIKPYFAIQKYNLLQKEYVLFLDKHFETLNEAQEVVKLLRKYKEPIYHFVETDD